MRSDEMDSELMKIEAVADVLVTVDSGDPARHTAAGLGVVILDACGRVREYMKGRRS